MNTNYYFKIVHENKMANKLEAAVLEEIKRHDRLVVNKYWVDCFKATLDEVIQYRASQHPRCKPDCVKHTFQQHINEDMMLYIGDFIGVRFYEIRETKEQYVGSNFLEWADAYFKERLYQCFTLQVLLDNYNNDEKHNKLTMKSFKKRLLYWAEERFESIIIDDIKICLHKKKEVQNAKI